MFLPQIVLLFLFLFAFEDSGYMPRIAVLTEKLLGRFGLSGCSVLPMLSSFACAVPGMMAARTISNKRDRMITLLVAPLVPCSARLPVYSLLIAAFIPDRSVLGPVRLQGLVMLGLYIMGVVVALAVTAVLKKTVYKKLEAPACNISLPEYRLPSVRIVSTGLFESARLFVRKAGTVILLFSIVIWFLSSFPRPPAGATGPSIAHSYAGMIGMALEPVIKPIGFNWQIGVALIPSFASREIVVGALATVYSVETDSTAAIDVLGRILSTNWSLATAMSLLVWYVLSCQCLSTIAVARRESGSWRLPALMIGYTTVLAYAACFLTYNIVKAFTG
ncbi:MAG: hypothetical protein A2583_16375 [Bdellovibrionales bacterium RIFOXYD1_FULL_53_11]|nr:MAG: hypothetical protein A2583_16375 [Bdellovibrionales bacterium RIFOXYD1_FULL_53_11]